MTYAELKRVFPAHVRFIPVDRMTHTIPEQNTAKQRMEVLKRNVYLCETYDTNTIRVYLY